MATRLRTRPRSRESTPFALDAAWVVMVILGAMALWHWTLPLHLQAQRADIASPDTPADAAEERAAEPWAVYVAPHPQDQLRHGG